MKAGVWGIQILLLLMSTMLLQCIWKACEYHKHKNNQDYKIF
jgi:hypothetical protein